MATAGVGWAEYLVHLHHVLCESYIEGVIGRGTAIEVENVARIETVDDSGASYYRVQRPLDGAPGLRLYGWMRAARSIREAESSWSDR
jgi:hypothetical protein